MWFSSDSDGGTRVTNVQEGDVVWLVIADADNNIDCDIRDKFWGDVKVMDPKTGAYIVWNTPECLKGINLHDTHEGMFDYDYFEETGKDTGVFVSSRPFQIGTRESYDIAADHVAGTVVENDYRFFTHVVDEDATEFQWGDFLYSETDLVDQVDDDFDSAGYYMFGDPIANVWNFVEFDEGVLQCMAQTPSVTPHGFCCGLPAVGDYMIGRFENMDTLIGMYQDPNDAKDIAVAMMKIKDTEATIEWDSEIYSDCNEAAKITIHDADENLNCNKVEYVPVFILVNPGSWNQTQAVTVNSFCSLKWGGGWGDDGQDGSLAAEWIEKGPIHWWNIYEDRFIVYPDTGLDIADYATLFDVDLEKWDGYTKVVFFARETGVSTGVFSLNINQLCDDLGFLSLNDGDVLVAYYLDPNDEDDFKLATAYIGTRDHISRTSFTDAVRAEKNVYWLGRDAVYVQVIDENANIDPCCPEQVVVHICDPHGEDDAEWLVLDETSMNSSVFFTNAGTRLEGVWDPLGVGLADGDGGYQLVVDNWKIEAFNEDDIYARYNDVYYGAPIGLADTDFGMAGLGDQDMDTSFPPWINRVRMSNDVSFDLMSIYDNQVFNGSTVTMSFLDRNGNKATGYVNSDCVFLQVIDIDQDEDQYRRERIDGYWDGGQNIPFGPVATEPFECDEIYDEPRCVNQLLGTVNIFNDNPRDSLGHDATTITSCAGVTPEEPIEHGAGWAKVYILNPRSGRWAAVDLLETGVSTGTFVSVTCIDLVSVYSGCVPTLDVLAGDTIVAFYQDPSNHSDSAMIAAKVSVGGSSPTTTGSQVFFADASGTTVTSYLDTDTVYVKVIDTSHSGGTVGVTTLTQAVEINGVKYDVTATDTTGTFLSGPIDLDLVPGTITVTYVDPSDSADTDTATATVTASELAITEFLVGPNPFDGETTFSYEGSGLAETFTLKIYDLAGHLVYSETTPNTTSVTWDGTTDGGAALANGAYIYVLEATDGTKTFNSSNVESAKGLVFINR